MEVSPRKYMLQEEKQFMQIDIPDGITSFLERKSGIFSNNKPPTYSVTEIIRCLRKSFYEKTSKKRKSRKSLDNLWPTVRGDLLHQMTAAYDWNELDMDFQIPLGNGNLGTISGRLDMYDWKTKTIIDLKTTKDVYSQAEKGTIPKKEDISQIQCYGTIFSNIIPIQELVLVYADLNDMLAFRIANEDKTWWLKDRILELEHAINDKIPPKQEVSKLCHFCKFFNQCNPNENMRFITENEGSSLNKPQGKTTDDI